MSAVIMDMTFNFCDNVSQMLSMRDWNVSLLSKNTPKSIVTRTVANLFSIIKLGFTLTTNKMTLIWPTSYLVVFKPFKSVNIIYIATHTKVSVAICVASKDHTSFSSEVDLWGAPNKLFSHELNSEFILVLCFLFGRSWSYFVRYRSVMIWYRSVQQDDMIFAFS